MKHVIDSTDLTVEEIDGICRFRCASIHFAYHFYGNQVLTGFQQTAAVYLNFTEHAEM